VQLEENIKNSSDVRLYIIIWLYLINVLKIKKMATKINEKLKEVKAIRKEIRRDIDKFDKEQLDTKISQIISILDELKQERKQLFIKNSYRMKDLIVK